MKTAVQAATQALTTQSSRPSACSQHNGTLNTAPRQVEWLVLNMAPVFCLYWGYWRDRYASTPEEAIATAAEYARQLRGLTASQITAGIERAKSCKFAPNPAELAALCKPRMTDIGAPSLTAVIAEIRHRRARRGEPHAWSHPLCWHIDQVVGELLYELSLTDWLKRVTAVYEEWEAAVAAGGQIPEPQRALPVPKGPPPAEALAAQFGIDISTPTYVPPNRRHEQAKKASEADGDGAQHQ